MIETHAKLQNWSFRKKLFIFVSMSFFLSISILHLFYIGAFLDLIVMATIFGFARYLVYFFLLINTILLLFNQKYKKGIFKRILALIFFFIIIGTFLFGTIIFPSSGHSFDWGDYRYSNSWRCFVNGIAKSVSYVFHIPWPSYHPDSYFWIVGGCLSSLYTSIFNIIPVKGFNEFIWAFILSILLIIDLLYIYFASWKKVLNIIVFVFSKLGIKIKRAVTKKQSSSEKDNHIDQHKFYEEDDGSDDIRVSRETSIEPQYTAQKTTEEVTHAYNPPHEEAPNENEPTQTIKVNENHHTGSHSIKHSHKEEDSDNTGSHTQEIKVFQEYRTNRASMNDDEEPSVFVSKIPWGIIHYFGKKYEKINFTKLFQQHHTETGINEDSEKDKEYSKDKAEKILALFKNFAIEAKLISIDISETIIVFELSVPDNVKLSKIRALEDNIKMSLSTKKVNILTPILGKSTIGVEIPNPYRRTINFDKLVNGLTYAQKQQIQSTTVLLGNYTSGHKIIFELASLPHLLIGGTTGSGKSILLSTIINSIILFSSPIETRLILIDPKRVEFNIYEGIPHLYLPIISKTSTSITVLNNLLVEMDRRYVVLSESGCRDIDSFNKMHSNTKKQLPNLVIVIDELADLMMTSSNLVEKAISRIAQLGRSAGIHLVVATQRPSVDVLTGLIKNNLPSRIALSMPTSIDSKTVLGYTGAEKLVGKGDMLISLPGKEILRGQSAYLSNNLILSIINLSKQLKPIYNEYMLDAEFDELVNGKKE